MKVNYKNVFNLDITKIHKHYNYTSFITDIEYQFTQPDYNIIEDTTVPVCVMIVPGDVIFTSGGFLTLRFLTSPITANCQFHHYK